MREKYLISFYIIDMVHVDYVGVVSLFTKSRQQITGYHVIIAYGGEIIFSAWGYTSEKHHSTMQCTIHPAQQSEIPSHL